MAEPTYESTPEEQPESDQIRETAAADIYDVTAAEKQREQSIRFLLGLSPFLVWLSIRPAGPATSNPSWA